MGTGSTYGAIVCGAAALLSAAAHAQISVVNNTDAHDIAKAMTLGGAGGITINNAFLSGHSNNDGASSGVYLAGLNNYGLFRGGGVLTTGIASDYESGPNVYDDASFEFQGYNWGIPDYSHSGSIPGVAATPGQEALLDPITGGGFDHYDVTALTIEFTPDAGMTMIEFDAVFGSEEFFEFVGTDFVDGFGIYLNGTNIAFTPDGPVNINHPSAAIAETELDGVAVYNGSPLLHFTGAVNPGQMNTLTFIIADTFDGQADSTVYIEGLGVPAPGALGLLAVAALLGRRRRRI